jgi:hypothetical protein
MGGKRRFVRCSMMLREVVSQVFCDFGANSGCNIAILEYTVYVHVRVQCNENSVELIINQWTVAFA